MFRYKMLYDEGGTWVDMDMICIKPLIFHEKLYFYYPLNYYLKNNIQKNH